MNAESKSPAEAKPQEPQVVSMTDMQDKLEDLFGEIRKVMRVYRNTIHRHEQTIMRLRKGGVAKPSGAPVPPVKRKRGR